MDSTRLKSEVGLVRREREAIALTAEQMREGFALGRTDKFNKHLKTVAVITNEIFTRNYY